MARVIHDHRVPFNKCPRIGRPSPFYVTILRAIVRLSGQGVLLQAPWLETLLLVSTIVDRSRGVDTMAAFVIRDGAGNILHELPELRGTFCHGHGSCVQQKIRVLIGILSVVHRRQPSFAITRELTSQRTLQTPSLSSLTGSRHPVTFSCHLWVRLRCHSVRMPMPILLKSPNPLTRIIAYWWKAVLHLWSDVLVYALPVPPSSWRAILFSSSNMNATGSFAHHVSLACVLGFLALGGTYGDRDPCCETRKDRGLTRDCTDLVAKYFHGKSVVPLPPYSGSR